MRAAGRSRPNSTRSTTMAMSPPTASPFPPARKTRLAAALGAARKRWSRSSKTEASASVANCNEGRRANGDEIKMSDILGYKGKRVVVSGCFSGMGEATAKILLDLGAEVHGLDFKESALPL